ncbi:SDR family oxidoreductase [Cellulomonas endophytica]|uniref:SDR family oxidoreductase n=1 Tax=Cellulomonas endophytica TaxID=2494735 RepID=UPI0010104685|nr:SDR family oxidoreductase [Cellulomonas endophytica]
MPDTRPDGPGAPERPGRTVLVTGATGGMGREIVAALAGGWHVVALGRREDVLADLARLPGVETWRADLTDLDALAGRVAGLERLDALVHSAAVVTELRVDEADRAAWEHHLLVDVVAPAELTRFCLPALRRASGTVVFVGSGAGTRPVPGSAVYTAAKHALRGLADVLRIDEAPHGVRVSTVAPGPTDTAMLVATTQAAGRPYEPERLIRPSSVAAAVRLVLEASPDVQLTDVAVRPRRELTA